MSDSTIKGAHVLATVIGFFAVILAANGIFITMALRTFPGQVVEKPYEAGVRYNEALAAKAAQEKLEWTADIERAVLNDGAAEIAVRFLSAAGDTLHGLDVEGTMRRPASDRADRELTFVPSSDGAYSVRLEDVGEGAWDLTATATALTGERFTLEKRLILQ